MRFDSEYDESEEVGTGPLLPKLGTSRAMPIGVKVNLKIVLQSSDFVQRLFDHS